MPWRVTTDSELTRLLGCAWRELPDQALHDQVTALPLPDLVRIASGLDLDPIAFLALALARPTPQDNDQADAWDLHAVLLYVGGCGATHTEAAEALRWDGPRLDHAVHTLTALLGPHAHRELAYHCDGRLHLRATGYGISEPTRQRTWGDPRSSLALASVHAAVLYAITTFHTFATPELPYHVIDALLGAGQAIHHTDGTLTISPDVDLSTSTHPLPPPQPHP